MAYQVLDVNSLKKYPPGTTYKVGTAIYVDATKTTPIPGTFKTVADPNTRTLDTATNATGELGQVNADITSTKTELSKFGNYNSYLDLLGNVFNASYLNNQDIINQREGLRTALYGEHGYKPATYNLLSPEQQEAIRTSNRPGIVAAIQALNETEQARGTSKEALLTGARNEAEARRTTLTSKLADLETRRGTLEANDLTLKRDNRQFGLDAMVKYPKLSQLFTEDDLNKINKGVLDESILMKINTAAAQETRGGNITQDTFTDNAGNSYIIGVDKNTGKIIYKTLLGKTSVSGGGAGAKAAKDTSIEAQLGEYLPLRGQYPDKYLLWLVEKGAGRQTMNANDPKLYQQWGSEKAKLIAPDKKLAIDADISQVNAGISNGNYTYDDAVDKIIEDNELSPAEQDYAITQLKF